MSTDFTVEFTQACIAWIKAAIYRERWIPRKAPPVMPLRQSYFLPAGCALWIIGQLQQQFPEAKPHIEKLKEANK